MYLILGGLLTCGLTCLLRSVSLCVWVHGNVHEMCSCECVRWTFACMWACGHVCRWAVSSICTCTNVSIPSCLSCSRLCSAKDGSWATVCVRASWDQRIVAFPTWAPGTRRWDLPTDHDFRGSWLSRVVRSEQWPKPQCSQCSLSEWEGAFGACYYFGGAITCTLPDGQYWSQIDYIVSSQRWRNSIQSKTRPGADCGSNHQLFFFCKIQP